MPDTDQFEDDEDRIDREAADWLVRRDAGFDPADRQAFELWLKADPRHAQRLSLHESTWDRFGGLAEEDLEPLPAAEAGPGRVVHGLARLLRSRPRVAVALAASVALGFLLWSVIPQFRSGPPAPGADVYSASKYENRLLGDGTILELNRGAQVRVDYGGQERRVFLVSGEAHFDVAKDPDRPFAVYAGGTAVRALGTAFNVRIAPAGVEIVVTEGRVRVGAVEASAGGYGPLDLAGKQRSFVPAEATPLAPLIADVSEQELHELLAWRPGTLELFGAPLGDVVTAFNKRNEVQIVLLDPELASLPVAVVFDSANVDAFTRMLELTFGIRAERGNPGEIALSGGR